MTQQKKNVTNDTTTNVNWFACNNPPQYRIPVTVGDCGLLYHRYAAHRDFTAQRIWQAVLTPIKMEKEGDVCVIRLENYDRGKADKFSIFDMFAAVFRALGQCPSGFGGEASLGSNNFFVTVAGAIPIL